MGGKSARIGVLLVFLLWTGLSEEARPLSLGRIVGGVDAAEGQVPYIVALYTVYYASVDSPVSLRCGASIYNHNTVITAAHCVTSTTPAGLCVSYGFTDISRITKRSHCLGISSIIRHNNYDGWTLANDIALLKLRYNLVFGARVKAVSLASAESDCPSAGTPVVISGWGSTSEGSVQVSNLLQVITVNVVDHGVCNSTYSDYGGIPKTQLCAAGNNKDTCQGDSGGPLVVETAGGAVLCGITSWGVGCAQPNYPGVYTCVSKYRHWIDSNARD